MLKHKIVKVCDYIINCGILAVVFFTPIYFAFFQENYNVFELNKLVFFRVLAAVMLVAYIAKIFASGKFNFRGSGKIFIFTLLVALTVFFSSLFSIHPQLSWWGSFARQQGFYSLVNYFLFFILLILNLETYKQIKLILISIVSASALVSLYGLAQYFAFDPLKWKEDALVTGRIFSSLGQPNFLGQYLILVIPVSFYALFFISKKFFSRLIIAIIILMQFACLIFTYSRAALMAFMFCLGLFIVLYLFLRQHRVVALSLIILGLVGLISIFSLNNFDRLSYSTGKVNLLSRIKSSFDLKGGSNKIRIYYWQAAITELKNASLPKLIIGYGPETLDSIFVKYYRSDWGVYESVNSFPDRAHNSIFDTILAFGFVGFFIILLFYYFILSRAIKYLIKNQPQKELSSGRPELSSFSKQYWLVVILLITLIGYFINNLFSFSLTVGYVYLYLFLALLWFSVGGSEEKEIKIILSKPSRLLVWLFLFFVAGLFIYFQNFNALRADYYYMKLKKAETKLDCGQILDNMDKTVMYNPVSTFYKERYIYHYLNCFSAAKTKEAQVDLSDNIIKEANSIKPGEHQFSTWLNIAHAKSLFGYYINAAYYQAAENDYNKLTAINPYITSIYKDLGRMQLWQGSYDRAIANFKKGVEVSPPLNHPYLNQKHRKEITNELVSLYEMLGLAYFNKKDFKLALDYYKQVLSLNPNYLPLYKDLADVYYKQGDLDKAIAYNQRGLMLNPSDYNWHFALALLYREKKNLVEAKKYLDQAMKLAPENEELKKYYRELNK